MSKRDYYDILGLPRDADEGALKKAYRKLAMEHHPDRNPDNPEAEEKFKELSEAYAILSDPEKRGAYDRFGHAGVGGPGGGPGGAQDFGGFGDVFNDLFGDLFGGGGMGGRRRGRGQRGADLRYSLELELSDVLEGLEETVTIPKMRACETCTGSGARPGTSPETCARCQGSGQMAFQQGFFRVNRPCDVCHGEGQVIKDRCGDCRGSGRVERQQTLTITVPPGVDDGARLRLVGEGEFGIQGGPPGDLYVVLGVREHELFDREGQDLYCDVPIPFVHAALGAEIEVPTLEGKVTMRVPEGTQSGKLLRLRGKGLPPLLRNKVGPEQLERVRGDLYVRIFVEVPTKLNGRQRELLEEFAEISGEERSPVTKGFLDKLREMFD